LGGLFRIKRGSGKDNKWGFLEKKRGFSRRACG
jgi:hypothetical protein